MVSFARISLKSSKKWGKYSENEKSNDSSDNLRKFVNTKKQTIYCGFDPTAKSLHIGNLVGMKKKRFKYVLNNFFQKV